MRKLLLLALAVVAMVSCEDAEKSLLNSREVWFTSEITTRASGTTWEKGDNIGVFMTKDTYELTGNALYFNANEDGAMADFSSSSPIHYPKSGSVDFIAYYPYKSGTSLTSYALDLTDQSDLDKIDLMVAIAKDKAKSIDAINLQFEHKLSNISVSIKVGEGLDSADLVGASVQLIGTKAMANYNLTSNEIDFGSAEIQDITLNTNDNGTQANGFVIPQTLYGVQIVISKGGESIFTGSLSTDVFEAGQQYDYTATITKNK